MSISRSIRKLGVVAAGIIFVATGSVTAAPSSERPAPPSLQALRLPEPMQRGGFSAAALHQSLLSAIGTQQVIVRLNTEAVAELAEESEAAQDTRAREVTSEQQGFLARIQRLAPGARVIARTKLVLNAVFLEVDARYLDAIAGDPAVMRVAPVGNYDMFLSETVPYIGATVARAHGFDGSGIRVAVLDSGIDYTHADLGGSGDPAEFDANDPNIVEPGTFPTARVAGGFDFVGADWPFDALAPDADPLDAGAANGHGTHVADIIGGRNGVAPGVSLYAVKVCSSVATSCSGVALIQGMEFAADPNGDGRTRDHVDVVNMSLGALYGQPFDDDLSVAVDKATKIGVLTVAAAGNSADLPFIVSTPAAANTALAVAQTEVPSAFRPFMRVLTPAASAGDFPAVFQPWSAPLTRIIEGSVQYGDGAGGNRNGCAAFAAGSLTGKLVVVDRGVCFFSDKIRNIQVAGGALGIIGLVAPGDPFGGGFGGGDPITIPGYMISRAHANILRRGDAVVRFDPSNGLALVGSLVSSSSRGPRFDTVSIKPEIGAPGASVSALAGTGTGTVAFGGTSGATPMVAGSAALVLQALNGLEKKGLKPLDVKAFLMNNADADILNTVPGALASITRIGAGEVRVDRAIAAPSVAWSSSDKSPALSFGFVDVDDQMATFERKVKVHNYSKRDITYAVSSTLRFANDTATGAVSVSTPASVRVKAGKEESFKVTLTVDGARLRNNLMSSGGQGGDPITLTLNEYDGTIVLDDGRHPLGIPWHILPRKAARVVPERSDLSFDASGVDSIALSNPGVGTAQNDAYALIATSPNIPRGRKGEGAPTPDIRAVGINTFPVPAGFCSGAPSFVWAFAINSWERQTHVLPVSYQVELDTNRDGQVDFVVLNRDLSTLSSGALNSLGDGRQVTIAFDVNRGTISAFFFTEHATSTGNTVLLICGEQVGLSGGDLLATNVDMAVFAQDFYFGGPGDRVDGLTVTPLGERFFGLTGDIAGAGAGSIDVIDFGAFPGNTAEQGVLLFTNGDRGAASHGGATKSTEALLLLAPAGI